MNTFASIIDQTIKNMFGIMSPEEKLREEIRRKNEQYRNSIHPCGIKTTYVPLRNTNRPCPQAQL